MVTIDNDQAQVHDLVRLGSQAVERLIREATNASESWVADSLNLAPWAVVRRAQPDNPNQVAIGIRGAERSQRWAAEAEIQDFTDIVTASAARDFPIQRRNLPAFKALTLLSDAPLPLPWGPGGSLGFELVTEVEVARESSDVDLIIYASNPLADPIIAQIEMTARQTEKATGAKIDILVETPSGAVAFAELARAVGLTSPPTMMLRTAQGPELIKDPWS